MATQTLESRFKADEVIELDGDTWDIWSVGATRERDGRKQTVLHIASRTRFTVQNTKNGERKVPFQNTAWVFE